MPELCRQAPVRVGWRVEGGPRWADRLEPVIDQEGLDVHYRFEQDHVGCLVFFWPSQLGPVAVETGTRCDSALVAGSSSWGGGDDCDEGEDEDEGDHGDGGKDRDRDGVGEAGIKPLSCPLALLTWPPLSHPCATKAIH